MNDRPQFQILPPLSDDDYKALKADIAARGVMVPVEYDNDGNVIDGHHRVRICEELGIKQWPRLVRTYPDEAAKRTQARKLNIARRHLDTASKRVLIEQELKERPHVSDRAIAADLGVSHHTVGSARDGLETTGQIAQLDRRTGMDNKTRGSAAPTRTLFVDDSEQGRKAALARAKDVRAETIEASRVDRVANIAEISKGNSELGTAQRYPVIYADPPWRYENPPMGGSNRSIENHYPTMTLEEICALPVDGLATEDAVLFLWATAPKLAECMTVIEAWGFTYRTCMVWVKDKIGMGYHVRNQHEILLIAKRGEIPPPPPSARPSSVLSAARDEHSAKPPEFYLLIEQMYPDLSRIELFSRVGREGWAAWGNQAKAA